MEITSPGDLTRGTRQRYVVCMEYTYTVLLPLFCVLRLCLCCILYCCSSSPMWDAKDPGPEFEKKKNKEHRHIRSLSATILLKRLLPELQGERTCVAVFVGPLRPHRFHRFLLVVVIRSVPARLLYRMRGVQRQNVEDSTNKKPIQSNPIASNRLFLAINRCFVLRRHRRGTVVHPRTGDPQLNAHRHINYQVPNRYCSPFFSSHSSALLFSSLVKAEQHTQLYGCLVLSSLFLLLLRSRRFPLEVYHLFLPSQFSFSSAHFFCFPFLVFILDAVYGSKPIILYYTIRRYVAETCVAEIGWIGSQFSAPPLRRHPPGLSTAAAAGGR